MARTPARLSKLKVRPKDTAAIAKPKPKKIIIFSDGTGNSAAALFKTNVRRFYEALDLARSDQIAIYDDGIGSSSFRPWAALSGAFGFGLARNVRALYAFLCRNYRPGDQIYAFGFSRGAFTIRVLVGVIATEGIIPPDRFKGEAELNKLVRKAYANYRHKRNYNTNLTRMMPMNRPPGGANLNGKGKAKPAKQPESSDRSYKPFHPADAPDGVKVALMGLWDTVDAYGLPIDEFTKGWDQWVWPLSMRNQHVWEGVEKVCHALALDDERNTFHPRLIDESAGILKPDLRPGKKIGGSIDDERITQVWFTGMHADVGGGYAKDGLSYVTLKWMVDQAARADLKFKDIDRQIIDGRADALGHINDSRTGFGSYYRLQPRRIARVAELQDQPSYKPKIHHSVFERIKGSAGAYAPIVLPRAYSIVDKEGTIHAPDDVLGTEDAEQSTAREHAEERVWDEVWKRRVAYFTTVFVTGLLLLVPFLSGAWWLSWLPVLNGINDKDKCVDSVLCFVAGVPKLLGGFLPGFASTWIDAYSANPGVFALLVGIIIALGWWGSTLKISINDRMSSVWADRNKPVQKPPRTLIEKIRENGAYKWFFKTLKNVVIPTAFGVVAAAFLYAYLPYVAVNRIVFAVTDAQGKYCRQAEEGKDSGIAIGEKYVGSFDTKSVCWATGLRLVSGGTYEITMSVDRNGWRTGGRAADPEGLIDPMPWWLRAVGFLTKRFVLEDYMVPIARIADTPDSSFVGQDEYVLKPLLPSADAEPARIFKSRITAASNGQLFLYVNDSILYWPKDYYLNNYGMAQVFVRRITFDEPMAPAAAARK
jgi:uncharacterized protein (DUF2235 family)